MKPQKHKGTGTKQQDVIFGINPVTEALAAGRRTFAEIMLASEKGTKRLADIEAMAAGKRIPVKDVQPDYLKKITATTAHQGAAARVSPYPYVGVEDIVAAAEKSGNPPFILLIDSVEDPHNLGALARTALCAGVHGLIIPKNRAAGPDSVASKVSAGATEHMRIARVANLTNAIQTLKKNGIWVAGLDAQGSEVLYDLDCKAPIALVTGGEDKGVRRLVAENCDFLVSIPQQPGFNSLNASVAGGIAMYEVVRQRQI